MALVLRRKQAAVILEAKEQGGTGNVSLIQPSESSPNPCKKMKVAGFEFVESGALMRRGGFCAMISDRKREGRFIV
jgi:hypothetical protein